jgi:hypothetical protein
MYYFNFKNYFRFFILYFIHYCIFIDFFNFKNYFRFFILYFIQYCIFIDFFNFKSDKFFYYTNILLLHNFVDIQNYNPQDNHSQIGNHYNSILQNHFLIDRKYLHYKFFI